MTNHKSFQGANMKSQSTHLIICVLAFLGLQLTPSLNLWAKETTLPVNTCVIEPESKMYLNYVQKNSSASITQLKNELGSKYQSLQDNPTEQYYFCQATCQLNGTIFKKWITHRDNPQNFSNMDGFLCKYVEIRQVKISDNLSIPEIHKLNFSIFNSRLPELNEVLIQNKVLVSTAENINLILNYKKATQEIITAYLGTPLPAMQEAAIILARINADLPLMNNELQAYIQQLNKTQWATPKLEMTSDFLVKNALVMYGSFFQFTQP